MFNSFSPKTKKTFKDKLWNKKQNAMIIKEIRLECE